MNTDSIRKPEDGSKSDLIEGRTALINHMVALDDLAQTFSEETRLGTINVHHLPLGMFSRGCQLMLNDYGDMLTETIKMREHGPYLNLYSRKLTTAEILKFKDLPVTDNRS